MKISVIGATSKIGKYLVQKGCSPLDLNILGKEEVSRAVYNLDADIIVNLASKSDVDWCEKAENQKETYNVNVQGLINLAFACEEVKIPIVTLSTDHIFDGRRGPYRENYSKPNPVNWYGMTKLGMESVADMFDNVKVVRTSYCFDEDRLFAVDFVEQTPTFIKRSFMYTPHFIDVFMAYLDRFFEMPKTLHISGTQTVSWYKFWCDLEDVFMKTRAIKPRRRYEKDGYVPRPKRGGLKVDLSKKLGLPQYSYMDGLRAMKEA